MARSRYERSDDLAVTVAEGNHFVAFEVLVPAESKIVAALLCHSRRPIAVDDADVEIVLLVKLQYGTKVLLV
jgi:hypothetical protein